MKEIQSGGQTLLWFTDEEAADYRYIASCLLAGQLGMKERGFVLKMEARFAGMNGKLSQPQWEWFLKLAERHTNRIIHQDDAVSLIRKAAGGEQ